MNHPTVVTLSGDIDVETRNAAREALEALRGAERAIVDLTKVGYIDSAGVSELLSAYRRLKREGTKSMSLVARPGSNVARLLELSGLDQLFEIVATLDEASSR